MSWSVLMVVRTSNPVTRMALYGPASPLQEAASFPLIQPMYSYIHLVLKHINIIAADGCRSGGNVSEQACVAQVNLPAIFILYFG